MQPLSLSPVSPCTIQERKRLFVGSETEARTGCHVIDNDSSNKRDLPPGSLKARVTEFYNAQSAVYDKAHHVAYAGGQYFVYLVATDVRKYIAPSGRMLEIGCGTGEFSEGFRRAAGEVISTDISSGMISMARAKIPEGDFMVADAERLPFADESFDCVAGVNTFSYFQNKHLAMSEIYRVLKTPGKLVLYDMNLLNPLWCIYPIFDRRHRLYFRQLMQSNRLWLSHLVRDSKLELQEVREFYWIPFSTPSPIVTIIKPLDRAAGHIPVVRYFGSRIKLVAAKSHAR